MNYVTQGYEPKRVLEIFEDICAIPHGSGYESGVADYIENFARKNQLFVVRDGFNNVFVRKNATVGYENTAPILLQGHTDMVCEKNEGSKHCFLSDGLKLLIKDGCLWADGTTLGGDDGIAVAMMLALLETDRHPTLECLFTVEEETGLAGAQNFDCSVVSAKRMINLDSEEECQITAGCAGGCRTEFEFGFSEQPTKELAKTLTVSLTGLAGGHSGAEINSGKANALVLLGRLLGAAHKEDKFSLVEIRGGGKDNAIAREAFAVISTEKDKEVSLAVLNEAYQIKKELSSEDGGFTVKVDYAENAKSCIDADCTERIIAFLLTLRTGVLKMSNQVHGLVEYSRNLGIAVTEGNKVNFTLSSRSSLEAQLDLSMLELDSLGKLSGAAVRHYARYPGWEFLPDSPLRELYNSVYQRIFGKALTVGVIHAGLECGILSSKMQGMDIISVGPDMFDIHSPDEHLSICSCERVWRVLLEVIQSK